MASRLDIDVNAILALTFMFLRKVGGPNFKFFSIPAVKPVHTSPTRDDVEKRYSSALDLQVKTAPWYEEQPSLPAERAPYRGGLGVCS